MLEILETIILLLGTIALPNSNQTLSENEKKTIRVNWKWKTDIDNEIPTGLETYDITVTILAKQKIK